MPAEDDGFIANDLFLSILWGQIKKGKIYIDDETLDKALNQAHKRYPTQTAGFTPISPKVADFFEFYRNAGVLNYSEIVPYVLENVKSPISLDKDISEVAMYVCDEMERIENGD